MLALPSRAVWQTYGIWVTWVSLSFFIIYPACNWLSALQSQTYALYFPFELQLPFVPEFFWGYVSMYVLFLVPPFFLDAHDLRLLGKRLVLATLFSGLIFLLLPTQLGFERVLPSDPAYSYLFAGMFAVDLPHNMVPSLHVVYSALILLALSDKADSKAVRAICLAWLLIIGASTLLVHQHHLLDLVAGWAVAFLFRCEYSEEEK